MLLPPDNFGLVDEGVYRCSKLDAINFAFLETLQLKSILILDNEAPVMKNFENFMKLNHIRVIKFDSELLNRGLGENNMDWMVFTKDIIQKVLKVLLNKDNYNLLMIDKTNVMVGILRKVCKWNCSSIIAEYRLLSGKNSNYYCEAFLDMITIELQPSRTTSKKTISVPKLEPTDMVTDDSMDIDDDENDDKLLSASPKVPKTLLRMVELRKKKNKDAVESIDNIAIGTHPFYTTDSNYISDAVQVRLPKEEELPTWLIFQRDLWDSEFKSLNQPHLGH